MSALVFYSPDAIFVPSKCELQGVEVRLVRPQQIQRVEFKLSLTDGRFLSAEKIECAALNLGKAPDQLTHSVKQAGIGRGVSSADTKANGPAVSLCLATPKT